MRLAAVGALAGNYDFESAVRGHDGSVAPEKRSTVEIGYVVHSENLIDGIAFEEAFIDEPPRPADLFRRLKNEISLAVEIARGSKVPRGPQEHRRVAIVTTSMHHSRGCGGIGAPGLLLNRERVDVGAQADGAAGRAAVHFCNHHGSIGITVNLIYSAGRKRFLNECTGTMLLKPQLRMRVEMPPPCG